MLGKVDSFVYFRKSVHSLITNASDSIILFDIVRVINHLHVRNSAVADKPRDAFRGQSKSQTW